MGPHFRLELPVVPQVLVGGQDQRCSQGYANDLHHQFAVFVWFPTLGCPDPVPRLIHGLLEDIGLSFRLQHVVGLFEDQRLAVAVRHLKGVEKLALIAVLEEQSLQTGRAECLADRFALAHAGLPAQDRSGFGRLGLVEHIAELPRGIVDVVAQGIGGRHRLPVLQCFADCSVRSFRLRHSRRPSCLWPLGPIC